MSTHDQRGAIHWGRSWIDWDGEEFTLTVDHFLHPWPCVWLDGNLVDRIGHVFAHVDPRPDLRADVRSAVYRSSSVDPGQITFYGLPVAKWPPVDQFCAAVEQAADYAYEVARQVEAHVLPFEEAIRSREDPLE
jgi:hypothetical protein